MVKFIKGIFKVGRELKNDVLTKATAMSGLAIDKNYLLTFHILQGYINGNPTQQQKLGWNTLIVEQTKNATAVCEDSGYEGMKLKDRVKHIGKEKVVAVEDMIWIEKELKPIYEAQFKIDKKDLSEIMFKHITSGEVSSEEAAPFFDKFQKQQHLYNKFK